MPLREFISLAAAFAALTHLARAVPQLRVFDGASTLTFADNGPGDLQPAAGQVMWIGHLGNWSLNVHIGTTYPAIGSLTHPELSVSFNATTSNSAGGTLKIAFATDGLGPTSGSATASISGLVGAGGSLRYDTYGGTDNSHFNTANLLTNQGPFLPGILSGTVTGTSVINAGPYSLTQVIEITHAGSMQTFGTARLVIAPPPVPESGTVALLVGCGLLGVGLTSRFRRGV